MNAIAKGYIRCSDGCQGIFLISPHQPRVANDIGSKDGGEAPFGPVFSHGGRFLLNAGKSWKSICRRG
jgi:hypothetical protein